LKKPFTSAPFIAAIARAYIAGENVEKLARFKSAFAVSDNGGELEDIPNDLVTAVKLRNSIRARTFYAGSKHQKDLYGVTEQVLYSFLKGDNKANLTKAKDEYWPIADDN